jgi:hypothetical protein
MAKANGSRNQRDPLGDSQSERKRRWQGLRRWWVHLTFALVLLVLGVTVAAINNPATTSPTLPLSLDAVGRVANSDVRAQIGFSVRDTEATERKRVEAEAAIRSVYDFEQELGQERLRRLREAFAEMRRIIERQRQRAEDLQAVEPEAAGRRAAEGAGPAAPDAAGDRPPAGAPQELDARIDAALDDRKGEFFKLLQVVVEERDFARLRRDRFSAKTMAAAARLVEKTMQQMIVPNRELLTADRARGITVRFLRNRVPQREMVVTVFSRIQDLDEALARVEQTAALELVDVEGPLKATIVRLAKALVEPNMFFNREETQRRKEEARENVQPLEISYKKDEIIIRSGEQIQKKHVRAFQQMAKLTEVTHAGQLAVGTVMLVVMLLLLVAWYAGRQIRQLRVRPKDLGLLALVMFVSLVSVKLWFWIFGAVWGQFRLLPLESYYFAIPFAAGAMLVRFVLNSEMALAFAAAFSVLAGLVMESNVGWAVYCLVSSLVAAAAVNQVRQRTSLLYAGALTGLANVVLAVAMSLYAGSFLSFHTLFSVLMAFSGGILAAIIVAGVAPLIEVAFGYTTDIKLLELANLNHPLLKDLIVQAPGSYHHSIIVGSLVEAGAESIDCNPLLARVMAYYHDIGKIKKPSYFSENQRDGINRHDKLKPSLSASVLRAHVKDGAELARESRLGQPILDAIQQHHGTSLMKFFYQRAREQAESPDLVKEEDFRYSGPKPQTREVALVMLADSVEAAAKSIADPSPARLQGLVQNMINRIFVDGQLDECDLTLQDLHRIARAFNRVLAGIYHHRPDYPEPATRDARPREAIEKKGTERKGPDSKPVEEPAAERPLAAGEPEADKPALGDGPGKERSAEAGGAGDKRRDDAKRQETPDDKQEDIKRLGI